MLFEHASALHIANQCRQPQGLGRTVRDDGIVWAFRVRSISVDAVDGKQRRAADGAVDAGASGYRSNRGSGPFKPVTERSGDQQSRIETLENRQRNLVTVLSQSACCTTDCAVAGRPRTRVARRDRGTLRASVDDVVGLRHRHGDTGLQQHRPALQQHRRRSIDAEDIQSGAAAIRPHQIV